MHDVKAMTAQIADLLLTNNLNVERTIAATRWEEPKCGKDGCDIMCGEPVEPELAVQTLTDPS